MFTDNVVGTLSIIRMWNKASAYPVSSLVVLGANADVLSAWLFGVSCGRQDGRGGSIEPTELVSGVGRPHSADVGEVAP